MDRHFSSIIASASALAPALAPAPAQQQIDYEFFDADPQMSAIFTLLCSYITLLMGFVTLKTGWSIVVRSRICLTIPFIISLVAIDIFLLQALWEWICNAQTGPHSPFTNWGLHCVMASWYLAFIDMFLELHLHQLAKLGKKVTEGLCKIKVKRNLEHVRKRHQISPPVGILIQEV